MTRLPFDDSDAILVTLSIVGAFTCCCFYFMRLLLFAAIPYCGCHLLPYLLLRLAPVAAMTCSGCATRTAPCAEADIA